MAAAIVVSVKMSPQAATLRLVVRIIDPFWYLREMTWKREAASSAGMGRYPSSSIMRTLGPEKNRMVGAQRPSRAALGQRAARSAAVVYKPCARHPPRRGPG